MNNIESSQAISQFKDFAIIWWNRLDILGELHEKWKQLKGAMCDLFVFPYQ
jgi:hypothetical protein